MFLARSGDGAVRAIKAFERKEGFGRELAVYQRLAAGRVRVVRGHAVPELVDHDAALGVIAMSVVTLPYVLDFAKVSLDAPPDFPDEVVRAEEHRAARLFGPLLWPRVVGILAEFRRLGVWLLDVNPRNIGFSRAELEASQEAGRDAEDDADGSGGWPEDASRGAPPADP
ncbi:MAG: hypothetical protein KDA05_08185 [Phycisphaerales bacterium]|nr:hypothetical protein [Phycisphaerales bacterium]